VGNNLKAIRKTRGYTQEELARLSGVARINIARYETGEVKPGADNLVKLAAALSVTVDELIGKKAG